MLQGIELALNEQSITLFVPDIVQVDAASAVDPAINCESFFF